MGRLRVAVVALVGGVLLAGLAGRIGDRIEATGSLLFVSDRDGEPAIFVADARSGQAARMSSFGDFDPVLSPDGTRIAFTSTRDGNREIYVMNADGSQPIRLTDRLGADEDPTWSPDGRWIAYESTHEGNRDVYVLNTEGRGNPTRLTMHQDPDCYPAWSPMGTMIAFARGHGQDGLDLYLLDLETGDLRRLTTDGGQEPAWSPDGSRIAFMSNRTGDWEIYVINVDGSNERRLTDEQGLD
ncbi:MAG: TolB family protein, partial [Actinomycetota bacterium]